MNYKSKQVIENLQLSLNLAIRALELKSEQSNSLETIIGLASFTEDKVLAYASNEVSFKEVFEDQQAFIGQLDKYVDSLIEADLGA